MSVANQLYQLQELDQEIESHEQALHKITDQLGENQVVVNARAGLSSEQQRLEELERQQHSSEWEINDLVAKLATAEEELYSGKIKNPKELENLQREVNGFKARREQLEDKALQIMDQFELAMASVADLSSGLETLEANWHSQQQQLSTDMEQLKSILSDLTQKRKILLAQIDPQALESYHELKKQRGVAVAKVEQGICRGCLISLPITDLQRAKSGSLVRCSSCGRILFLA